MRSSWPIVNLSANDRRPLRGPNVQTRDPALKVPGYYHLVCSTDEMRRSVLGKLRDALPLVTLFGAVATAVAWRLPFRPLSIFYQTACFGRASPLVENP